MAKIKLNLGGELLPGDLIGIANTNFTTFGWFVQAGKYGSLQFIPIYRPITAKNYYDAHLADPSKNVSLAKRFSNGLLFKHVGKDFVLKYNPNRVFKIHDADRFFKDSDMETEYKESKKILQELEFPAK